MIKLNSSTLKKNLASHGYTYKKQNQLSVAGAFFHQN
jgi:hypothetical protein